MRTTFKVSFFLKRQSQRKNGHVSIIARITVNKEAVEFSTKLTVAPELWNVGTSRVNGRNAEAVQINTTLEGINTALQNIYFTEQQQRNPVSAEKIRNKFLGQDESKETLLNLYQKHNTQAAQLVGKDISKSTYSRYELGKRRLYEFLQQEYNCKDIALKELNLDFIQQYETFLRSSCDLGVNAAAKMIMYLKKMVTFAFNNGIIPSHPFAAYKIRRKKVDRGYLTQDELNKIINKKIKLKRLEQVRDIFVFCCFTGLAYIDVRNLYLKHIRKSFDGKLWIMTKRIKTGIDVNVPLLDLPLQIFNKYKEENNNGKVLPVISNQRMNGYLKELADICDIDKNITFHLARHTFATTITMANGIPIETISKMLGHADIQTTQIYARMTQNKISSDMLELSKKLNKNI